MCSKYTDESHLLLCDLCSRGFHVGCVGLTNIPTGSFYCNDCEGYIIEANASGVPLDPTINLELWESLRNPNQIIEGLSIHTLEQLLEYEAHGDKLYKKGQGEIFYVPTIGERELLTKHLHYLSSHTRIKRTIALIQR